MHSTLNPLGPRRCNDCNRPFTLNGLGTGFVESISGGMCLDCGKPAVAQLGRSVLSLAPSHLPTSKEEISAFDEENAFLENLVNRISIANENSAEFMSSMKKARQRSTDAKKAMTHLATKPGLRPLSEISLNVPFHRKVEEARAELSNLEKLMNSITKASTLVELQECSNQLSDELIRASREIRRVESDNARREKELEKLARTPIDLGRIEDTLKKELFSLRSRNAILSKNIEMNEKALIECLASQTKLRLDPTADMRTQRLAALRKEKEELRDKEYRSSSVSRESFMSPRIASNPTTPQVELENAPSPLIDASRLLSVIDVKSQGVTAVPTPKAEPETPEIEVEKEDANNMAQEGNYEIIDLIALADPGHVTQEESDIPLLHFKVAEAESDESCDGAHETDEVNARQTEVAPRKLFQAIAATAEPDLGKRPLTPGGGPIIQVPRVFRVESRGSSLSQGTDDN